MKKILGAIIVGIVLILGVVSIPFVFERVDAGEYKVVQNVNGELEVLSQPGWQFTGLVSKITPYKVGGIYYFSSSNLDGGSGEGNAPIKVVYRDSTVAMIGGNIQYRLPVSDKDRIELHILYDGSYDKIVHGLIKQSTMEALKQSATYLKGEEAYTTGRAKYGNLIENQLRKGIYAQEEEQKMVKNAEGNEFLETIVRPKKDKDGNVIISKESKFAKFGVEILGLNIKDIDLDDKTKALIEQKKDAEFRKITAKAEAEEARQNKITEELKGETRVAKAKAEEQELSAREIEKSERNAKITKIEADKQVYVKQQEAKEDKIEADKQVYVAEKNAKALITRSNAELKDKSNQALANAKLVRSGLTPEQAMNRDITMNRDKWQSLEKANLTPKYMFGGGGKGGDSTGSYIAVKTIQAIEGLESKATSVKK